MYTPFIFTGKDSSPPSVTLCQSGPWAEVPSHSLLRHKKSLTVGPSYGCGLTLRADWNPLESKSQPTTADLRGQTLTSGWCGHNKGQGPQQNAQKLQLERDQAFSDMEGFFSGGQLLARNLSQPLNLASGPMGWQLSGRKECRLHLTLSLLADV